MKQEIRFRVEELLSLRGCNTVQHLKKETRKKESCLITQNVFRLCIVHRTQLTYPITWFAFDLLPLFGRDGSRYQSSKYVVTRGRTLKQYEKKITLFIWPLVSFDVCVVSTFTPQGKESSSTSVTKYNVLSVCERKGLTTTSSPGTGPVQSFTSVLRGHVHVTLNGSTL